MSFVVRFLISIPLFYFIYQGRVWALVSMFLLMMLSVESMAYVCMKLVQRCNELNRRIKQIEQNIEKTKRINNVLSDVFDNKP